MKRIFSMLLSSMLILTACDNNKSAGKEDKANADSIAKVKEQKQKAEDAKEKIAAGLEKLTPLTEEQLKAMMPETIKDAMLTDYSFTDNMGAPVANGIYKISDSSSVMLTISDCAGPGGAGLYNLQYAGQLEYTNDNDNEYTKVIDFNGAKAIEFCKKTSAECSFIYFSGARFLVMLEGKNVNADELKNIASGLKIK